MVDQEEIHKKRNSADLKKHRKIVDQLCANFRNLHDKEQAWQDLHRLTSDKDRDVRREAADTLGTVFQYVPDEEQAWQDLHRLTSDKSNLVQCEAAEALGIVIKYITHKEQVWQDLHRLTSDEKVEVRCKATKALGIAFQHVPNKEQAWKDLHKLTLDEYSDVRWKAAHALRTAYQHVPDKEQARQDLHRLTSDENSDVRWRAANVLGTAFQYVPYKEQEWRDLHRLTSGQDIALRRGAAGALGIAFQYVPDKKKAWKDLHRLTSDKDSYVRWNAVNALGTVFQYVSDKEQVWKDLHRLTSDQECNVVVNAYHSLGRISIYKASQSGSDEAYLEELNKAIEFFENAAKESSLNNPSKFCLPFYRSFYTIISAKKRKAKNEVAEYLSEAKNEIGNSKNKKLLFDAVENLANALKEVQNLENMDLQAKKGELDFYRKYCEQAAELMKNTEETAPSATIVMRKGFPIFDRNLKSLLEEIQEKAETVCQVSKGPAKKIACAVNREVQKWEIGSQEEMSWHVENLVFTLESTIPRTPKNQHVFDRISQIREEKDVIKQYSIVCTIIPMIPHLSMDERFVNLEAKVDAIYEGIKELVICTKPGISEEIVITTGFQFAGSGAQHVVTIPLQDISYSELKEDLGKIRGKTIDKLSKLPDRLAKKVKGYLLLNDREDVLEQLS